MFRDIEIQLFNILLIAQQSEYDAHNFIGSELPDQSETFFR
jgi:hypothetical protein